MFLRRLILIICIVAILPTAVDPSCIGYYMYSNAGLSSLVGGELPDSRPGDVDDTERPVEGLAATRIPSQVSIAPQSILDLWVRILVVAPSSDIAERVDAAPDFLAPTLRHSFLRHSVLLI